MAGIVRDRTSDAAKQPRPGDSHTRARNGAVGDACGPAPHGTPRVEPRAGTVRGEDPATRSITRGGVSSAQQPKHPAPKHPTSGKVPSELPVSRTGGRKAPLGPPGVDVGPA